ncbi:MAG: hypothetical protein RLZZ31_635, partial [Actinomycetota bacterium]
MGTAGELPIVNMFDPEFWIDIHAPLQRASEQASFAQTPGGELLALGHKEVEQVLRDPRMLTTDLLANNGLSSGPIHEWWSQVMFSTNPPVHTRLRRLVSRAFTPKRIEDLRPVIAQIAEEVLQPSFERGEIDLLHDYAHHLPIRVMSHMLAIPQDEYETFAAWTADLGLVFSSIVDQDLRAQLEQSLLHLDAYVRTLIEHRRKNPGDDLLSALIAAEEEGDRLNNDELVAMIANLLFAGHDTTRSFLSIALPLLLSHPDEVAKLKANPTLISSATEECLRFEPPVMGSARQASEDLVIGDVEIAADQAVSVSLPAANRDPIAFPNPNQFLIDRFADTNEQRPAVIASFGQGVHFCL